MTTETLTGPICACGHPVAGHGLAGCHDNQWFDETSHVWCPCELTEDDSWAAATAASQGEPGT